LRRASLSGSMLVVGRNALRLGERQEIRALDITGTSSYEGAHETRVPGCRHPHRARPYRFRRDVDDPLCLTCAILYRPVLRRAIYVSLVVGTILTAINQGDVLLAGALTPIVAAKILLTYLVPYSVSTFSALSANRVVEAPYRKDRSSP
jgi:hypothetical protein